MRAEQCIAHCRLDLGEHPRKSTGLRQLRSPQDMGAWMDVFALMTGIGFFKRLRGSNARGGSAHGEHPPGQRLQAALGARMLVVDDSPTICAVLGKILGQDGYAVLKAVDGESAIELARSAGITLIGFARPGSHNIYTHPDRLVPAHAPELS